MLYEKETAHSVEEVVQRLQEQSAAHKFGVLGIHDLKQKMADKGFDFGPQCRVLEVCSPAHAKQVLDTEITISNALPCRIAVYERDGKVLVSTLLPTQLLGMFQQPSLEPTAKEVEESMLAIIDGACA